MRPQTASSRSGWSLIEVVMAAGLATIVAMKASMIMSTASEISTREPVSIALNDQANMVLDRIALAILGSDRDTLVPQFQAPIHTGALRCRVSLGMNNGNIVWDDPIEIGLQVGQQVVWRKKPDQPDETRVVWTNFAQPLLEGEVMNGLDDNGNGLIDEEGLTFILEGDSVTIRLSLSRPNGDSGFITETVETTVTIRNRPE